MYNIILYSVITAVILLLLFYVILYNNNSNIRGLPFHNQGGGIFTPEYNFFPVRMKVHLFLLSLRPLVYYITERELYYGFAATRQHKVLGLLLAIGIDNELITLLAKMRSKMVTRY